MAKARLLIASDELSIDNEKIPAIVSLLTELNPSLELCTFAREKDLLAFLVEDDPLRETAFSEIVLLDKRTVGEDTLMVVEELKKNPPLSRIPILCLSEDEDRADQLYALHVNCFIRKPESEDSLRLICRSIDKFWFQLATIPAETFLIPWLS